MTEAEAKSILTQWHMWWGEGLEQLYEISCTLDYQGLYPDEVAHQYDYIPGEQIEAAQAALNKLKFRNDNAYPILERHYVFKKKMNKKKVSWAINEFVKIYV